MSGRNLQQYLWILATPERRAKLNRGELIELVHVAHVSKHKFNMETTLAFYDAATKHISEFTASQLLDITELPTLVQVNRLDFINVWERQVYWMIEKCDLLRLINIYCRLRLDMSEMMLRSWSRLTVSRHLGHSAPTATKWSCDQVAECVDSLGRLGVRPPGTFVDALQQLLAVETSLFTGDYHL